MYSADHHISGCEYLAVFAPSYITDMLQPASLTLDRQVTLRSVDNNDLFVFRSRLRLGERAFHIAAPRAWNSLPSDAKKADTNTVKTFKKRLKSFLFCKHYGDI